MFNHRFAQEHRHGHGHCKMSGRDGGDASHGRRGRGGPFGRHRGGPFGGRGPRMFDPGALRLVVLGLIAEEPRHGYDIIKALEARFQGAYSPSPGAIYPMLQMLEEADLVSSTMNGNKRLFTITGEGLAWLEENRAELDKINAQLDEASEEISGFAIGEEMRALRRAIHGKLRSGTLTAEQAEKARDILRKARVDLDNL
ncbi:PadR family transcriptional regulator [Mesorhizobium sp. ZC-5]|uniref:PadR family transcriptional regulator n=1 Tax=Mesorhizobium sp. ZC-5 TaxID=2986066 RepID=UPI0021E86FC7|nr:PadR family transcriptional regulator [Mesorhizobium sp. ZC-5]MCV3241912.1 PadR family transcriptional regulator [Mesorhizobium sp. ZC-5]